MSQASATKTFIILERLTDLALQKLESRISTHNKNAIESKTRHETLIDFHHQYILALRSETHSGIDIEIYQNYQRFLDRLDESIRQQSVMTDRYVQELKNFVLHQQSLHQKKLLYQKLIERINRRERNAIQKSEQKLSDSYALRRIPDSL